MFSFPMMIKCAKLVWGRKHVKKTMVVPRFDAACGFTRTAYQIILFPCQMKNWKLFSFTVKFSTTKTEKENNWE